MAEKHVATCVRQVKGKTKHDMPYANNLKFRLRISGWELILEEPNFGKRLRNYFKF